MRSAVLMIMVSVGFASCTPEKKEGDLGPTVKVSVQKAAMLGVPHEYQYPGKVIADDKTVLSTKATGMIEQILVTEGEKVEQGQLLVKIRNEDISSRLAGARASLREAQSSTKHTQQDYNRIKRLHEKGSSTQKELDDISTALEVGTARVEFADQFVRETKSLLEYTVLRSPIDGFVSQKFLNNGAMAAPGVPLIALESFTKLKVRIGVPEFEIGFFEKNDPVQIQLGLPDGKLLRGYVERIVPSSAFSGTQFQVLIGLDGINQRLKPGMFARVRLLKNPEFKTILPSKAIVQRGQLSGIYTVNQQGRAMLRWIRLGREYPEGVEVLSGITAGEEFVLSSSEKLVDGINIEIINRI